MHPSRRILAALSAALLCSLLLASGALAGTPATVTVRVLGQAPAYEALTPPTVLTTTTSPVTKDGDGAGLCSGTSAAGALELGTAGNWEGVWSSKFNDYEVVAIDGHSYPFEEGSPANYYWSFWQNEAFAEVGICEAELGNGDQILFVPSCYGEHCPPAPTQLLGVEAPATAEAGKPVTVAVRAYPAAGGNPVPAAGVTVTGGGAGGQTDSEGKLALTFAQAGAFTLRASGTGPEPRPIPGEANICVHNGSDGTCGTTIPPKEAPHSLPAIVPGPDVVHAGGVLDGRTYSRRHAPRVLSGSVDVPAGGTLGEVSVSLQRSHHGRCSVFDGSREAFIRAKCHVRRFFRVARTSSFSYLLPKRLPAGRYVYVIRATGDAPTPSSVRVVFSVK